MSENGPEATTVREAPALLSVVLPVYNEEHVLEELARRVGLAACQCAGDYEIIFVNDGSSDGSGPTLDHLAARNGAVRVIHLARNFGHQAAVQAGLAHASGDCVVLMDSDLQDVPEAIPAFVQKWREGFDVVYAVRCKRKERWWKRALFAGFHRLLASVSHVPIPADAGNFSLIDRRAVREIVAMGERDRYLPGLRSWVGHKQCGLLVERAARYDERPRVSLRGLWRLAKTAIFSFSTCPLSVFHLIGVLSLSLFVGLAGFSLYCKLFTDLAIPGWTSHILSASFFGALNALGISILGEYVIRIYDQVRQRPIYVVDRRVNCGMESRAAGATRELPPSDQQADTQDLQTMASDDALYIELMEEVLALRAEAAGIMALAQSRSEAVAETSEASAIQSEDSQEGSPSK